VLSGLHQTRERAGRIAFGLTQNHPLQAAFSDFACAIQAPAKSECSSLFLNDLSNTLQQHSTPVRQECDELSLECLGHALAPPLGDRQGRGIGEDVLFVSLEAIENSLRR
jgi:hypothetical protein